MEYCAEAVHQGGLEFSTAAGSHAITTDYPLDPAQAGSGPRPLELLLASLASCAGGALIVLLRRAGPSIGGLKVVARGDRRAEHPTVFTRISLEFVVRAPAEAAAVATAIEQSEAHICPVWAMLKPGTPISSSFRIED